MRRSPGLCAAARARLFASSSWEDWLLSRRPIGEEPGVATFYEAEEKTRDGSTLVRRTFELHAAEAEHTDISPEWLSWLRGTRAVPPSSSESAAIAAQRAQTQHNAAELARSEVLRRERARVLKPDAAAGPADALGEQAAPAEVRGSGGSYAPQSWTPGAASQSGGKSH